MIEIDDIRSLTDFQRNAKTYAKRLNRTGRPMVLTVNGKPGFVVQDAESYQELMEKLSEMQERDAIGKGLEQVQRGECVPAIEALEEIRKKYGIPH